MKNSTKLIVNAQATLGEGPHWDHYNNCLYWVDILEMKLHIFTPEKNDYRSFQFDEFIGAVVPDYEGNLIIAMQHAIYRFNIQTNEFKKLHNTVIKKKNNRFNDGKCDPSGRFWIGTMDLDGKEGGGELYQLDTSGQFKEVLSPVSISNGLAWSPDKKYMYYIDTPTNRVDIYHYDDLSGEISFYKIGVRIPKDLGNPDGMTIDGEGMIWVAHWGGAMVSRWDAHKEILIETIQVPAKNVTSCTFGGENLDELYITTARHGLSEKELIAYPESGGLFMVKTCVQGLPSNFYGSQKIVG